MAFQIPTTQELAALILAAIEAKINQTTPPVAKAFNKVLSVVLALVGTGLYKFGADRILQVFALTATGDGLDTVGSEYGVTRHAAIAAVLEFEATGTNGVLIPAGTDWTSESTGEIYTTIADVTIAAGVAVLNGVASTPGDTGNLANGEILTINTPIAQVDSEATVTDTITEGEDRETDTAYRRRVLTRIRAAGGGGNAADYRQWSEDVDGVRRAFPYSGKPRKSVQTSIAVVINAAPLNTVIWAGHDWRDEAGAVEGDQITLANCPVGANDGTYTITSINLAGDTLTLSGPLANDAGAIDATVEATPGDRVVYIESTDTGVDGVPTPTLLDLVRAALLNDPDTGDSRDVLGLIEERLYVEPIDRLYVKVNINGLEVAAELEATVKAQLTSALDTHLYDRVFCFVEGLDYEGDRVDSVTEVTVSGVVWGILKPVGAFADDVQIKFVRDAATAYQLDRGELTILEGVYYDGVGF